MSHKLRLLCGLALFLTVASGVSARDNGEKGKVKKWGLFLTGIGENEVFTSSDLIGAPGYHGKGFWAAGVTYSQSINKWLEWETGLEYSRHKIEVAPNLPPQAEVNSRVEKAALITVPLSVKATFLKYLFASGGILFDADAGLDSPIDSQTGIGTSLGVGAKYDFKSGISLFVNPYLRFHSLVPFSGDDYHQQLWDDGVKIGITFPL